MNLAGDRMKQARKCHSPPASQRLRNQRKNIPQAPHESSIARAWGNIQQRTGSTFPIETYCTRRLHLALTFLRGLGTGNREHVYLFVLNAFDKDHCKTRRVEAEFDISGHGASVVG
jgi:hypothetical protein